MAEDKNLALIKGVTFNWVTGQFEKILPLVADDAVYEIGRGVMEKTSPLFGTFKGKKKIAAWYETNRAFQAKSNIRPFCRLTVLGKFIVAGNQVINYGSMPKTRAEPMCDWIAIWTVKRGKIAHCWLVLDTAAAFVKLKKHDPSLTLG